MINGLPRAAHLLASAVADQIVTALARPRRLVPIVPIPPNQRKTRLIHRELPTEQLAELTANCRREGVTVHSALLAAMAITLAGPAPRTLTIGSPVDFRADLVPSVDEQEAGAYVATVPSHLKVTPDADLWSIARAAGQDLRRRRRLHQHLALVSLLRLMSPPSLATSKRAVAMVDRMGPGNICLSNLGRFDFPDRIGSWRVSGAQFVAGISVSGYLVAAVNTSHGALYCNFTYIDGALTSQRAERIAEETLVGAGKRSGS